HPESRQELKQELESGQLLGNTSDGKQIILLDWQPDSSVIREIGRLREYSFRKVGEGSGKRRDLDQYDQHYKHLVLWDDRSLEMVGAYRFGDTRSILQAAGVKGLYTASLFEFDPRFEPVFEHGLELGRSFVQPQYWGSRALDYLWQGLGAYLRHHREIRYLFGPVSISERYPRAATDLLVNFYLLYFGDERGLVTSKNPYRIGDSEYREAAKLFTGKNFRDDLQELKLQLSQFGLTIPTLYKQYTDLCEAGGVRFLDFGVDPAFSGCTDGFILVELDRVKAQKRKRYIGE
ncbi:MAG: GNAT family N-acetyltransferase, partial [Gammaproteobacteria bacterium]